MHRPQCTVQPSEHRPCHVHTHQAPCRCREHSPHTLLAPCSTHRAGPQEEQSSLALSLSCRRGTGLAGGDLAAPRHSQLRCHTWAGAHIRQQQLPQAASPLQHTHCSKHWAFLHGFRFGECHPSCLCSHTQLPQRQEGEGLEQDVPQPHRVMCILTATTTTGSRAPPVPAEHQCGAMPHEAAGAQHLQRPKPGEAGGA